MPEGFKSGKIYVYEAAEGYACLTSTPEMPADELAVKIAEFADSVALRSTERARIYRESQNSPDKQTHAE